MGLFDTINRHIRRRRERREVVKRFGSYVDPDLVDYVLSTPAEMPAPDKRDVEFVLAVVEDDELDRLPELLRAAVEVLLAGGARVDSVSGSLVLGTFGAFPPRNERHACDQRRDAAHRLHERLRENVRIIHGAGRAVVGNFGSDEAGYWHYGCSVQHFSAALQALAFLRRGEVREWSGGRTAAE